MMIWLGCESTQGTPSSQVWVFYLPHWVQGTIWLHVSCDWQDCREFADGGHLKILGSSPWDRTQDLLHRRWITINSQNCLKSCTLNRFFYKGYIRGKWIRKNQSKHYVHCCDMLNGLEGTVTILYESLWWAMSRKWLSILLNMMGLLLRTKLNINWQAMNVEITINCYGL